MAQSLQRHLDLPDVQRAITTVVLIQPLFRHLYGTALSSLPTHANSLGMLAMVAEGGGATSTNHAVAAVVPLLLLPQALGEELTQRLQVKLLQLKPGVRVSGARAWRGPAARLRSRPGSRLAW